MRRNANSEKGKTRERLEVQNPLMRGEGQGKNSSYITLQWKGKDKGRTSKKQKPIQRGERQGKDSVQNSLVRREGQGKN